MGYMSTDVFEGRLGIQQRVLPTYRVPFFDALGRACRGGLSVFAGQPRSDEAIHVASRLECARYTGARNLQPFTASSPFYLGWQIGLLRWLEEWQPDVLIVEANPRVWSTRLGISWMGRRGRPVIGWGLGAPPIARKGFLATLLDRDRLRFLHSLDAMIAYSQRGAEEYRALGIQPERVVVAPNAVSPRPVNPPALRLAGQNDPPVVLFVGRLQARKRVDHLLQACASLPLERQPRLWIVGDGPAMEELRSLASQIYPQAEFFGARHGLELEPFFTADLFVLPGTGGLGCTGSHGAWAPGDCRQRGWHSRGSGAAFQWMADPSR